ncbi:hypothetical protein HYX13_01525 [Candidatus Woesearchaeota archaeon]|nr:hypothetical protein [Candidatus Woesearchaeota archaeon]
MKHPITALDEIILAQFQKVTDKAAKCGYSKYDLKTPIDYISGISMSSTGCYIIGAAVSSEISSGSIFAVGFGTLYALAGIGITLIIGRANTKNENKELEKMIKTGAAQLPELDIGSIFYRLSCLGFGSRAIYNGACQLTQAVPTMDNFQDHIYGGLIIASLGIAAVTMGIGNYLKNTTMIPPRTKKLHQRLYEKAKDFLSPAPQLQPVRVPVNNNLENSLQSAFENSFEKHLEDYSGSYS